MPGECMQISCALLHVLIKTVWGQRTMALGYVPPLPASVTQTQGGCSCGESRQALCGVDKANDSHRARRMSDLGAGRSVML